MLHFRSIEMRILRNRQQSRQEIFLLLQAHVAENTTGGSQSNEERSRGHV